MLWGLKDGLAEVKLGKKWGLINKNEEIVIEIEYDEILKLDTNLFLLKKGEELKLKNLNMI
ncbi:WG repeat-containing protein [Campylobacter lari]|uniref:WG repeat-containing protein n=1 Tax=Campylobacter sp. IFREMER_LSEM_CL908 TaxID=2911624 RepID=UPI0021E84F62|nr:WG repeat-containing protein [Campylobacter sp. IFREMER_LSEM_CL908]EGK8091550.1 WG repeat-containing protein [Campylobacter lari]MCV3393518.1 WG repeat-containing protein [Campylobacter sp. IFREMER_LSEM_CL908]